VPVKTVEKDQKKRFLSLEQNSAEIVKIDKDVSEIFVANPEIADVTVNSPGVAYIYAKKPGSTTIFAGNKDGITKLNMEVQVTYNLGPLKRAIRGSHPNEHVIILSTPSGVILEGDVSSPQASKDIVNIAQRYIGEKDQVVNSLGITTPTQVYLEVKVAEVNRTAMHTLNISTATKANIGSFTFGVLTGRDPFSFVPGAVGGIEFNRPTGSSGLNTIGFRGHSGNSFDISGLLDALGTEGLSTILAEPNLIALSGETAKVLVGGEFPYPVPQGNNTVTIQFKQFGVSLDFTPTVLSGNLINLHVRPEVSQLDPANGAKIVLAPGEIETIPALKTRRAETTVELASGSSLAIAGLFTNAISNTINEYPGLAQIPVLGALFRSSSFQKNETDLVIIVTPYLVEPVRNHSLQSPTDDLRFASFLGMILGGRLNRMVATPGHPYDGFTTHLAASSEVDPDVATDYETSLASSAEPGIPANDQSQVADKYAFNRPEDLSQGSENLAGPAGFYVE
jgi:pilus assembly protein CpaC